MCYRFANEFCVVANSSELDVNGTGGTFAWADTKCSTLAAHMCRIMCTLPALFLQLVTWHHCCITAASL